MSNACDELLIAVLRYKKYELAQLDEHERIILRSRSSNFIFYVDVCCLGAEPGELQVFAYSLDDFRYGPQRQNCGRLCEPESITNRKSLLTRRQNRYQFGVEQVEFAFQKKELDSFSASRGHSQSGAIDSVKENIVATSCEYFEQLNQLIAEQAGKTEVYSNGANCRILIRSASREFLSSTAQAESATKDLV